MLKQISIFKDSLKEITDRIWAYVTDKSIPLEYRWAVFTAGVKGGILTNYTPYWYSIVYMEDTLKIDSPYDYFHVERRESVKWHNIIDMLKENLKDSYGIWKKVPRYTEADINIIKEAMLASKAIGAVYDW